MKIGIIDYGMGNLHSVVNALSFIGVDSFVSADPVALNKSDKLILPGVGAFKDAMDELKKNALHTWIKEVSSKEVPLLGICLGMQLLFESSEEHGLSEGLGLLKGHIKKLEVPYKIPHMGWNELIIKKEAPIFKGLEDKHVYFVHSYHLETDEDIVSATTNYGKEVQVAAQQNNLFALQFHPEKSGDVGLNILKNFSKL
ncbi:glutamine amidotransferase [Natranaerovirga pectinivora]|uniref:Imidazole glycerol phosphate synthase subunit HisH n=1 Tax=Natranaerovirga pectinivora TaxID=682400 RepID=A0A4R3MR81_9FIRM|nr:imidazole glycerol phosphate synthase subunit HisH [Natranaerovirga pectinivora]TCT17023.1 glutamine amidotransferase [Natranaerovirga pectinivora]